MQVSQHEESGAQGSEEAQPLWATQAHCTDPHGEKARSPQDQALGARGGPHDADGGLAAFSMGDIRMAEKAVESGMTLEGYFRRVKASGARGPQDGPSAAEANPLDAPKDPPPQQQHRPQEEGSSTLWNTDLAAHSATVGLGGVPLEADVEEEFSFLEETVSALMRIPSAVHAGPLAAFAATPKKGLLCRVYAGAFFGWRCSRKDRARWKKHGCCRGCQGSDQGGSGSSCCCGACRCSSTLQSRSCIRRCLVYQNARVSV